MLFNSSNYKFPKMLVKKKKTIEQPGFLPYIGQRPYVATSRLPHQETSVCL